MMGVALLLLLFYLRLIWIVPPLHRRPVVEVPEPLLAVLLAVVVGCAVGELVGGGAFQIV
jgi:hypothetical protein